MATRVHVFAEIAPTARTGWQKNMLKTVQPASFTDSNSQPKGSRISVEETSQGAVATRSLTSQLLGGLPEKTVR